MMKIGRLLIAPLNVAGSVPGLDQGAGSFPL